MHEPTSSICSVSYVQCGLLAARCIFTVALNPVKQSSPQLDSICRSGCQRGRGGRELCGHFLLSPAMLPRCPCAQCKDSLRLRANWRRNCRFTSATSTAFRVDVWPHKFFMQFTGKWNDTEEMSRGRPVACSISRLFPHSDGCVVSLFAKWRFNTHCTVGRWGCSHCWFVLEFSPCSTKPLLGLWLLLPPSLSFVITGAAPVVWGGSRKLKTTSNQHTCYFREVPLAPDCSTLQMHQVLPHQASRNTLDDYALIRPALTFCLL